MNYVSLHKLLLKLERQISNAPIGGFPAAVYVRPNGSPVQGFALDKTTQGRTLPVIVTIGMNYTQANTSCPRCLAAQGQVAVEDNLASCRTYLNEAFANLNKNPQWLVYKRASIAHSIVGVSSTPDYHLVMTNFCLWNTTLRWLKIPKVARQNLRTKNPHFAGGPTAAPLWPHLLSLAQQLAPGPLLWVAHGLHAETFDLFMNMLPGLGSANWMMTPNLGYRYFHYGTCYPRP